MALGRIYLIIGIGYLLLFTLITSLAAGTAFGSTIPLLLPFFAVIGSLGGLMAFTNDRLKGVFEYLIAYGISPRRLFANVLAASLVLVSIVIGTFAAVGLSLYLATGHAISAALAESLALYSVPMSYASAAFAATVGMFWTSLSSPRAGMNSPVGLIPLVGMAPSILTVIGLAAAGASRAYLVLGVSVVGIVLVVLSLLRSMEKLMPRERLLAPT